MKRITAVIVTYNRIELLKVAVNAIRDQSMSPEGIIVVNNGSTDQTKQWLDEQSDIIAIHQENCGGAGGFQRGMKEGFERGYEWIWVMDDDGYPERSCLERLYEHTHRFKDGLVALSSAVYDSNDKSKLCFKTPLVNKSNRKYFDVFINPFARFTFTRDPEKAFDSYEKKGDLIEYLSYPFNSNMYNRKIFNLIGYPVKDFFIRGDEIEFSLRIIKKGIPTFLVPDSIFYNPNQMEERKEKSSDWKRKYGIRNNTIIVRKYQPFYYSLFVLLYSFLRIIKQRTFYLIPPFFDGLFSRYRLYKR